MNVDELYQNAIECDGALLDTTLTYGEGLPICFWSLSVLKTNGPYVCSLIPDDLASAQGYAAGVDLVRATSCQDYGQSCDGELV